MSDEKQVRRTKVKTLVNCYVEGSNKKPVKVPKNHLVLMTEEEIEHFEDAVTKDVKKADKELPEFKRG